MGAPPTNDVDVLLREHLRELGRKGGLTRTTARLAAIAKARNAKLLYKRDPSQHPNNRPADINNNGDEDGPPQS
jgi:hypothetical protein